MDKQVSENLRALTQDYLTTRDVAADLDRRFRSDEDEKMNRTIDELWSKTDDALRALRAGVLEAHGLDPRLPTPRPVAVGVIGAGDPYDRFGAFRMHIVVVAPDVDANVIPDPTDGRRYSDGVRERDVCTVVDADEDWRPWRRPEPPQPEPKRKKGRKKARR